ncbi:MAG TPA: response regulator transcription factor [Pirellulales bacterium]|jgi:DNA-binding NarL/FixJ family response regulator|nr:response regulator transcription factor [Pirellulales bacterium]
MKKKLRVFLADDHAVVRAGLKALINAQADMEVVDEATDGRTARDRLQECQADIAVIDLSMPEINGMQLTEWLTRTCPKMRVVALTVHQDAGYMKRLIQAGAKGYVVKRAAAEELIHALRKVSAGEIYLDPSVAARLVDRDLRPETRMNGAVDRPLTDREVEVARLIAQGYSNKEVASRLRISVKTVETHKARVMEKLGIQSRVELVQYAMDEGWLQVA